MRKAELKKILKEIGLLPRKYLGQNFLASEKIAERIVDAASLSEKDFVVEVGPGLGVVTEKILQKGVKLLAVEIDKKLSSFLRNRFSTFKNFNLIEDDFFNIDEQKLLSYNGKRTMKFISNPPYRGAKRILKKLSTMNTFRSIVITLQKEVANTLLEVPGTSKATSLTYYIHYRFIPTKLFEIPQNFFFPVPTVRSSTILLTNRVFPMKIFDEKYFFKSLDLLMRTRRKKLTNNIKSGFRIPHNKIMEIMEKCKIPNNARTTDLSIEQIIKLTNLLREKIPRKGEK
ncbi:ribosomal RNA small subunit methyltransferase A [candidate division WOR-3 bacterium]|nr:ribosomal RNA small subunit methyltransferase A [candidate division WOR-3 bacterium]